MFRRNTALLLSLLTLTCVLTGCGSSNSAAESSPVVVSAPSQTADAVSQEEKVSETTSREADESGTQKNSSQAEESSTTSKAKQESSRQTVSSKTRESSQASKTSQTEQSKQSDASQQPSQEQPSSRPVESSQEQPSSKLSEPSQSSQVSKTEQSSQPQESSKPAEPQPVSEQTDIGGMKLYNSLFSLNNKIQLEVQVAQSEMDKLQQDYYKYKRIGSKSPIYRKATVKLTVGSEQYTIEEVGIRLKGNMSLKPVYDDDGKLNMSHYKLSFNETFDDKDRYGTDVKKWASEELRKARKNRRLATLKELDIKWNLSYDETYIRELYAAELSREQGVIAQHINLAQLTFNGQNYGVMKIYEPVDEIFLEKNLPVSALGGDLYKCGWTFKPCNYVYNEVTFGVEDKDKGKKYNYNLKTNKKSSDHASLKNLLKVISMNPSKAELSKVVDTDYFAKFLAVSYFLGDPDDIRNNYNNHYIYFRKDNGKAIFIVYDNDRTLGVTYGYNPDSTGMTGQSPFSGIAAGADGVQRNPLIKLAILNSNACLKTEYTAALKAVAASGYWDTALFNSYYEKARSHYESVVKPSVTFANVKEVFRFSLDGKYPSGEKANMSFADYVTRIMKTFHYNVK